LGVAAARKAAFAFDPKEAYAAAQAGSFRQVAEDWIKDYVIKKKLRTQGEIERILRVYVYPSWAARPFFEIKRLDVNVLLRRVEEKHGAPQADAVLKVVRGIMNWYATQDGNYVSQIVRGMHRDKRDASERARDRILDDNEIRAVWTATEDLGRYGAMIRILLLTGQRLSKVVGMKWSDIGEDGVWRVASEAREKGNIGEVRLPPLALDIIRSQPQFDSSAYIFASILAVRRRHKAGGTSSPPQPFGLGKQLSEKLGNMPHWTLHDLRRTARSLMADKRCGVADNIAERVLGHKIGGVHGIYNRHDYFNEKSDALQKLANLVEMIINPPDTGNVVDLAARR
jgi:integrase